MPTSKTPTSEVLDLRREIETLRAARAADPGPASAEDAGAGAGHDVAGTHLDVDWEEVKTVATELADEIAQLARQRPVVGIVAAFLLGVVVGRVVPR